MRLLYREGYLSIYNLNILQLFCNIIFILCLLLYRYILDKSSLIADVCCMILSNVTRFHNLVDRVISFIEQSDWTWNTILGALVSKNYNTQNAKLHYLALVICNLTQSSHVRRYNLLDFIS